MPVELAHSWIPGLNLCCDSSEALLAERRCETRARAEGCMRINTVRAVLANDVDGAAGKVRLKVTKRPALDLWVIRARILVLLDPSLDSRGVGPAPQEFISIAVRESDTND